MHDHEKSLQPPADADLWRPKRGHHRQDRIRVGLWIFRMSFGILFIEKVTRGLKVVIIYRDNIIATNHSRDERRKLLLTRVQDAGVIINLHCSLP